MQGLLDWFANLPAQVQSGWIAGLTAMITTVLTVSITQLVASHNLKKTLAENRATARETIEANKDALNRTLQAEALRHQADLDERRTDRLFEKRLELKTQISAFCTESLHYYVGISHEPPSVFPLHSQIQATMSLLLEFDELGLAIEIMQEAGRLITEREASPLPEGKIINPDENERADNFNSKISDFNSIELNRVETLVKRLSEEISKASVKLEQNLSEKNDV